MESEEPIESTNGVLIENSLKVKSATQWSPIALKVWELGNFMYLGEEEAWCFL